ncbi:MAG: glycerophosphodiester phosphodiesterase [Deltaproteobacteria bacterium]|nr:glycerophosphodiester phosphodiesterase [Deltaproteobacteria bacterium]
MRYFAAPRPRVFGHRGACGVAPENTLPSFALAVALGADYLELDVHATRDGEIVVLHDAELDRTTSGSGPVSEHAWAAVAALDAGWQFTPDGRHFPYRGQGVRVPRLAEVLTAFPAQCLNIEIKQGAPAIVAPVLAVLRAAGALDRTLLAAEHDAIMTDIRAAVGDRVATGMSVGDVWHFMERVATDAWDDYVAPGRALQVPAAFEGIEIVTPAFVAAAHRAGMEVHVWAVNDAAEIARLFDLGVDGVMSDLPGLVASAARARRG